MKILSLGSLNIDYVYRVNHINREGETISAREREMKQGGKGLNQSVALARAGAEVWMAGCVGEDGQELLETLRDSGVNISLVSQVEGASGHAIIQLAQSGENAIMIFGGANRKITPALVDEALRGFTPGDYFLVQNEISCVAYGIQAAKERGMRVVFNPSPISEDMKTYPLEEVDLFILNKTEGQALADIQTQEGKCILKALAERFPRASFVLTLGGEGALYYGNGEILSCDARKADVVDTTGAGDTFCGYFLASIMVGRNPQESLDMASQASALAIEKKGAAVSIPTLEQVKQAMQRIHRQKKERR